MVFGFGVDSVWMNILLSVRPDRLAAIFFRNVQKKINLLVAIFKVETSAQRVQFLVAQLVGDDRDGDRKRLRAAGERRDERSRPFL